MEASNEPALSRGDQVRRAATDETGVVLDLDSASGVAHVSMPAGMAWIPISELEPADLGPARRLVAGQFGDSPAYMLFLQARYLKHAYRFDPLSGLSNARIEPEAHQVYIAHRVTQKLQPRMILADEVGLGKTIEAGLVIKELRARGVVDRVLIVCPANLQLQWQQELRSKFNEDFDVLNGAALKYLGQGGANPWTRRDNVITSLTLVQPQRRHEQIMEAGWDLVVFDEAHRVRRRRVGRKKVEVTLAYRLADELKELVGGLLLLTATPMQIEPFELFSLVELVEPGLYPTFDGFERSGEKLPALNDVMKALKGWGAISEADKTLIRSRHPGLFSELGSLASELDDPSVRDQAMDQIARRHPLAQAMVRNRKAEIGGFTKRQAKTVPVELTEEEAELYQDVTEYIRHRYDRAIDQKQLAVGFVMVGYQKMLASSSHAIRKSLKGRIEKLRASLVDQEERSTDLSKSSLADLGEAEELSAALAEAEKAAATAAALEGEILELEGLVDRLGKARDSKAAVLLGAIEPILASDPGEKILIFTQFIETQDFLAAMLEQNDISVATFNGEMSLEQKERSVRRFRDEDGAQVLISTEAGGEGRNFQFAHILFNYDLPWNPMKVEQRIGRLDRIGQDRTVLIYNLACVDTVEMRVLQLLGERIRLFEESVGSLDPILGDVEARIADIVMADLSDRDALLDRYERDIEEEVRQAREKERTLADFAMDRESLRRDVANDLLGRSPLARSDDLRRFASDALNYFGGSLMDHPDGGVTISLSPRLATRLRERRSSIRGVFDPAEARRLEELDFFAFGHDVIDRIVELPLEAAGEVRIADVGVRMDASVDGPAIEAFYQVRVGGVRPYGHIIRHVIHENLVVHEERLGSVPESGEEVPSDVHVPAWCADALAASAQAFAATVAQAKAEAEASLESVKDEERSRAERIFEYRRVRLDRQIEEETAVIDSIRTSGTERQQRILPAREAKLAKAIERRERLVHEHDAALNEIAGRTVSVDAELFATGIVLT